MRTEEDLRTALATREQLAPDPGPMLEGLGQAVRRRRMRLATSSAVATLAAGAVAAVLAVPTLITPVTQLPSVAPPPQPPARTAPRPITDGHAADRPDFSFTIASATIAGYEIRPAQLAPEQQAALVIPGDSGQTLGVVALMRPGSMADAPPDAPNSEVNGEPAWFVENLGGHLIGTLYWEYAPDALALLSLPFPEVPAATFVAIAEGVTFVDPYPAHVPYRLEYLPADLRPIAVSFDQRGAKAIVNLANDIGDVEPEDAHPRAVDISILDNRPTADDVLWPGYTTLPWEPATTIGAHSVRCADAPGGLNFDDHQLCEIEFQGDILILDVFELTPAELEQVIVGLTLADLADPESWFTITDALP